jgi:hypothetical protein
MKKTGSVFVALNADKSMKFISTMKKLVKTVIRGVDV